VRAYGRTSSASDSSSDSVCVASDQRLEGRCDVVQCGIRFLRVRYSVRVRVSVKVRVSVRVRVSVKVRVSVRVRIYWCISITKCYMFDYSNLADRVPDKGRERRGGGGEEEERRMVRECGTVPHRALLQSQMRG
jgi:hypothetical protein